MNVAIIGGRIYHAEGSNALPSALAESLTRRGVFDVWADTETARDIATKHNGLYWENEGAAIAEIALPHGRVFLHDIARSPWQMQHIDERNAPQLMAWVDKFVASLKARALQHSPNYRFISTLAGTRNKRRELFDRDLPDLAGITVRGLGVNWIRELPYSDVKSGRMHVHKFDMRAAWLATARTAQTGYGKVAFLPTERQARTAINAHSAGYWTVTLEKQPVDPAPIMTAGVYETGTVRAALERGQPIKVESGWTWLGQATALRQTVEHIISGRTRAMGTTDATQRAFMERMYKLLYTRGLGVLDRQSRRFPWQYQPHWYHAVKAESVRRMWQKINVNPGAFAADVDTLYIVSDVENPLLLAAFGNDTGYPGAWRYEGSTPLTAAIVNATRDLPNGAAFTKWVRERNCLEDYTQGVRA